MRGVYGAEAETQQGETPRHGSCLGNPDRRFESYLLRFGEKGIQHGRQFLEPPICHARIADGIGMRAIISHRGWIKSAVLIDEGKGRFWPVLVGHQSW
jgi:hypothetical protein